MTYLIHKYISRHKMNIHFVSGYIIRIYAVFDKLLYILWAFKYHYAHICGNVIEFLQSSYSNCIVYAFSCLRCARVFILAIERAGQSCRRLSNDSQVFRTANNVFSDFKNSFVIKTEETLNINIHTAYCCQLILFNDLLLR